MLVLWVSPRARTPPCTFCRFHLCTSRFGFCLHPSGSLDDASWHLAEARHQLDAAAVDFSSRPVLEQEAVLLWEQYAATLNNMAVLLRSVDSPDPHANALSRTPAASVYSLSPHFPRIFLPDYNVSTCAACFACCAALPQSTSRCFDTALHTKQPLSLTHRPCCASVPVQRC